MSRTVTSSTRRKPGRPPRKRTGMQSSTLQKSVPVITQDPVPQGMDVPSSAVEGASKPETTRKGAQPPKKETIPGPVAGSSGKPVKTEKTERKPVLKKTYKELSKKVKKLKRKYAKMLDEEVAAKKRYKKAKGSGKIDKSALDELKSSYRAIRDKADLLYIDLQVAKKEKKKIKKSLRKGQK
jgi:hypothetical protein